MMFIGMHTYCKNRFVNDASTLIEVGFKSTASLIRSKFYSLNFHACQQGNWSERMDLFYCIIQYTFGFSRWLMHSVT